MTLVELITLCRELGVTECRYKDMFIKLGMVPVVAPKPEPVKPEKWDPLWLDSSAPRFNDE